MSLIYLPLSAGILFAVSDKFFKNDFTIKEIANEISNEE